MSKKPYYGMDGRKYDSLFTAYLGSRGAYERRRQTRLLQNQLELEEKMMNQEVDAMNVQRELEEEKIKVEREKINHEKEMYILKALDEVSIPKDLYDNFVSHLFSINKPSREVEESLNEEDELANKLTSYILTISNKKKELERYRENNTTQAVKKRTVKYNEKYKKYEDVVNGKEPLSTLSSSDFENINLDAKKYNSMIKRCGIRGVFLILLCLLPVFIFGIFLTTNSINGGKELIGIIAIIFAISIFMLISSKKKLKIEINDAVYNTALKEFENDETFKKLQKEQIELKERYDEVKAKNISITKKFVEENIKAFYNFRINHYNLKMEKLFIDLGLAKRCQELDLDFKNISKDEIIKYGEFEDYFQLFSSL